MTALALGVLVASLLGSVHCAGMCGGLVALYAGGPVAGARGAWLAHLAYNVGRLVAYAGLGALAGLVGASLDASGLVVGVQRLAAVVSGVLITAWGAALLLQGRGLRLPEPPVPAALRGLVTDAVRRTAGLGAPVRGLGIGLVTGLLPCGWLWAFAVTAAGTGSVGGGAALMTVFWAGTLPMMLAIGLGLRALMRPLARHLPAVCGLAMLVIGALAVAGRLQAPVPRAPTAVPGAAGVSGGQSVPSPPGHAGH